MAASRRLAAIVAADVAGYSRPMGADEEATLKRLTAHRRQLDHRRWEAVSATGELIHAGRLPYRVNRSNSVSVTCLLEAALACVSGSTSI